MREGCLCTHTYIPVGYAIETPGVVVQGGVCHSAVTMRLRSERCGNERDSSPTPGHIFRPCFGPSQWQRMGAGVMKLYFPNLNFHFYDTAGHRYNVF